MKKKTLAVLLVVSASLFLNSCATCPWDKSSCCAKSTCCGSCQK